MFEAYYKDGISMAATDKKSYDYLFTEVSRLLAPSKSRKSAVRDKPANSISPSIVGGCKRRLYLEYISEEREEIVPDLEGWPRLQIGHLIHAFAQAAVKMAVREEGKHECWTEALIKKPPFYGFADLVLASFSGKPWAVCDIKSMRSYAWKDCHTPYENARFQVAAYMRAFDVRHGSILHINVETGASKEFLSDNWLHTVADKLTQRIKYVRGTARNRLIPPPTRSKFGCTYCPFPSLCKEIGG